MKQFYRYATLVIFTALALFIIYVTVFVDPRCKVDGNPLDCDDKPLSSIPASTDE